MATKWTKQKVNENNINSGNEYEIKDAVSIEALNSIVNNSLFASETVEENKNFVEHLTDTPDTSEADQVGTPSIEFVDNVVDGKTYKKFKFSNLKGATGDNGESATIQVGDVTTLPAGSDATVENVGTESEAVLNFGIPKGETGGEVTVRLPLGTLIPSTVIQNDASLHLADGSILYLDGVYGSFVQWVIDRYNDSYNTDTPALNFVDESVWLEQVNKYGQCGYYAINIGDNPYIRLPKITKIIEGLSSLTDIGKTIEAGLPNINGSYIAYVADNNQATGTFSFTNMGTQINITTGSNANHVYTLNFDALQANSIYGNSNTVQPQSIKYPYYIVVATGAKTDVEIDINNVANDINDLNTKKADKSSILVPNGTYETYTVTGSGQNLTAPANGWFCARGETNKNNDNYANITMINETSNMIVRTANVGRGALIATYIPVKKGDVLRFEYANLQAWASSEYYYLRFYYGGGVE